MPQAHAPMIPERTSPEPAVASAAFVPFEMTIRPDGVAMIVCAPLSTTTAFDFDEGERICIEHDVAVVSDEQRQDGGCNALIGAESRAGNHGSFGVREGCGYLDERLLERIERGC